MVRCWQLLIRAVGYDMGSVNTGSLRWNMKAGGRHRSAVMEISGSRHWAVSTFWALGDSHQRSCIGFQISA
jgi:hypothetical protein